MPIYQPISGLLFYIPIQDKPSTEFTTTIVHEFNVSSVTEEKTEANRIRH